MTLIIEFRKNVILAKFKSCNISEKIIEQIVKKAGKQIIKGYIEPATRSSNNREFFLYSIEFIDGENEEYIFDNLKGLEILPSLYISSFYLKQDIVIVLDDSAQLELLSKNNKLFLNSDDTNDIIGFIEANAEIGIKKKEIQIYTQDSKNYFYLDIQKLKNFEKLEEKLKGLEKHPKILDLSIKSNKFVPYTTGLENNSDKNTISHVTELKQPNWPPTSNITSINTINNDTAKLKPSIQKSTGKAKESVNSSENNISILRFQDKEDAIKNANELDYIEITNVLMSFMAAACRTLAIGFHEDFGDINPEISKDNTILENTDKKVSDDETEEIISMIINQEDKSDNINVLKPVSNQISNVEIESDNDHD